MSIHEDQFYTGDKVYHRFRNDNSLYAFDLKTWEMEEVFENVEEEVFLFEQ